MNHMVLLCTAMLVFLSGCSTFREADKGIAQTSKDSERLLKQSSPKQNRLIEIVDNYWVSTKEAAPKAADLLPPVFKQREVVRAEGVPFAWLISNIVNKHSIPIVYSSSVQRDLTVSVDFRGDLAGALNAVANATTYRWEYKDGNIFWDDLDTRAWSVPMTPGASNYLSRVGGAVTTAIQGATEGSTTSTANGGGGDSTGTGNAQRTARQSDSIDVWKDMTESVQKLLSRRGTVTVSQSTSTISVRDYPDRLQAIDAFIKNFINEVSRQVYVQVEVIEVRLNKDASYGIDWEVVKNSLNGIGVGLTTTNTGQVFPKAFTSPVLTLSGNEANSWNGSKAMIKALETQGDVSVRTQPRIITMNNQVAALQIGSEVGYLAKSETTVVQGAGATTALTPGVAKSGFMMYLLPRIMPKNDVIMQMSVSVNNINNIRTVTSNGSSIEIPEITTRNFQQLTRLRSGESMVLAGFRQMNNDRKAAGIFSSVSWLFGAESAVNGRVDTILIITPYVLMDANG